ncbi:MAG: thiamine pyrophosphate-dependent enzyme [Acetobacteraceae bacterium]
MAQMDRREALAALLKERGDMLIVTGLGSASYDLHSLGDHDANYYLWGAMGGAALVGLGIAQAQPSRKVVVLTGDGEQLMGMGGLATIGVAGPPNLTVVVIDNGHFGETGLQQSHTDHGVDLTRVALACGFESARRVTLLSEMDDVRAELAEDATGPRMLLLQVKAENLPRSLPIRDAVHVKNRFRMHLGLPVT